MGRDLCQFKIPDPQLPSGSSIFLIILCLLSQCPSSLSLPSGKSFMYKLSKMYMVNCHLRSDTFFFVCLFWYSYQNSGNIIWYFCFGFSLTVICLIYKIYWDYPLHPCSLNSTKPSNHYPFHFFLNVLAIRASYMLEKCFPTDLHFFHFNQKCLNVFIVLTSY